MLQLSFPQNRHFLYTLLEFQTSGIPALLSHLNYILFRFKLFFWTNNLVKPENIEFGFQINNSNW